MKQIQNWLALAQQSNWQATSLAKKCGVSVRTLQRYFLKNTGKSPKKWLAEQRQHQALELLRKNRSVKEVAIRLGYKHPTHFSREFAKHLGCSPTQFNPNDLELARVVFWSEMAGFGS